MSAESFQLRLHDALTTLTTGVQNGDAPTALTAAHLPGALYPVSSAAYTEAAPWRVKMTPQMLQGYRHKTQKHTRHWCVVALHANCCVTTCTAHIQLLLTSYPQCVASYLNAYLQVVVCSTQHADHTHARRGCGCVNGCERHLVRRTADSTKAQHCCVLLTAPLTLLAPGRS